MCSGSRHLFLATALGCCSWLLQLLPLAGSEPSRVSSLMSLSDWTQAEWITLTQQEGGGSFLPPIASPPGGDSRTAPRDRPSSSIEDDVIGILPPAESTTADIASFLVQETGSGVSGQRRSSATFDPRVRGYHIGQINATSNGELWMPVRNDLDSILGKIDPNLVQRIDITPGPYAAHYGPGLSFIDVVIAETPRYACAEWHNRLSLAPVFNGGQFYASETVYGGSSNYGFVVNYGNRTGSDYLAGNGTRVPASYHDQNILAQFGWDLTEETRVEIRYSRLDRTDVEYALQFFDVDFLGTDSVSGTLISTEYLGGAETRIDTWYNRTRFFGNTNGSGKRSTYAGNPNYFVIDRVEAALASSLQINSPGAGIIGASLDGKTRGDQTSTGVRFMVTDGEEDSDLVRTGADFRYQQQFTAESFTYAGLTGTGEVVAQRDIFSNQPTSNMSDAGLFGEWRKRILPGFQSRVGGRIDWVTTDIRTADGGFPADPEVWAGTMSSYSQSGNELGQGDVLFSSYWSGKLELTENWSVLTSVGYGERAPTLTERYADGVFLAILQSGFTRVIGQPGASKERAIQADWTIKADFDNFRGTATFFNAWISDYLTYDANQVSDPTGAVLLQTFNTPLATLTGTEVNGELALTGNVSLIGGLQYVAGTDRGIDQPLPQIAPLDSRLVIRWADRSEDDVWGVDFGARMVAQQNRLGFLRLKQSEQLKLVDESTPGFMTLYLRGHYRFTNNLNLVAGAENLANRNYFEHLNRRLPADAGRYPALQVFAPGFSPYFAVEWVY